MVALWFVLAGLVEVGSSRLQDALRLYGAASVVALLTLVDAGLLTAA
jgi:hypothetical protein